MLQAYVDLAVAAASSAVLFDLVVTLDTVRARARARTRARVQSEGRIRVRLRLRVRVGVRAKG